MELGRCFYLCIVFFVIFYLNSKYIYYKCYLYDGNFMKYILVRKCKNCVKSDIFVVFILMNNDKSLLRNFYLYE